MILVDTSVWIDHFRTGRTGLDTLLSEDRVFCHPFVIGELACGHLKNRVEILTYLQRLKQADRADDEDVLPFIETHSLMGKGLGYVDVHLLMSAMLARVPLLTLDKRLQEIACKLLPAN